MQIDTKNVQARKDWWQCGFITIIAIYEAPTMFQELYLLLYTYIIFISPLTLADIIVFHFTDDKLEA